MTELYVVLLYARVQALRAGMAVQTVKKGTSDEKTRLGKAKRAKLDSTDEGCLKPAGPREIDGERD